jgi:hypothetical protein
MSDRRFRRALAVGCVGAAALLFGLWFAFVRAPGPQDVCRHIMQVTMREASQQDIGVEAQDAAMSQLEAKCIQHKLDKIQLRGRVVWAKYAKCVLAFDDLDQIWMC